MILVTGSSGFLGSHLVARLRMEGQEVREVDVLRDYYSKSLKLQRRQALNSIHAVDEVLVLEHDLAMGVPPLPNQDQVSAVIHLAAQPGVRLPPERYGDYERDNLAAFAQVLAFTRQLPGKPVLLFASSSSVYGDADAPFVEDRTPLNPTSYYGVTKVLGEQMGRAFAEQAGVPTIAMRFFTAYGPWGRPDMAYMRLASAALGVGEFSLFGDGSVRRDFTFVDDIVISILMLLKHLETVEGPYFEAVNIGGGRPVSMLELIDQISTVTNAEIPIASAAADPRDARVTEADFTRLMSLTGQVPRVQLEEGVQRLVDWAREPHIRSQFPLWMGLTGRSG